MGFDHFEANYNLEIEATGPETVVAGGQQWPAGKYILTYTGPKSEKIFKPWFSTDFHRKPARIRVPFPLGIVSAELE